MRERAWGGGTRENMERKKRDQTIFNNTFVIRDTNLKENKNYVPFVMSIFTTIQHTSTPCISS
jgi:hypothetical protein